MANATYYLNYQEKRIYDDGYKDGYNKGKEITATALQREYTNGYLTGQKKAYDECDEVARELSQIKTGCSKWLDEHDVKIKTMIIDEFSTRLLYEMDNMNIQRTVMKVAQQLKEYVNEQMR